MAQIPFPDLKDEEAGNLFFSTAKGRMRAPSSVSFIPLRVHHTRRKTARQDQAWHRIPRRTWPSAALELPAQEQPKFRASWRRIPGRSALQRGSPRRKRTSTPWALAWILAGVRAFSRHTRGRTLCSPGFACRRRMSNRQTSLPAWVRVWARAFSRRIRGRTSCSPGSACRRRTSSRRPSLPAWARVWVRAFSRRTRRRTSCWPNFWYRKRIPTEAGLLPAEPQRAAVAADTSAAGWLAKMRLPCLRPRSCPCQRP